MYDSLLNFSLGAKVSSSAQLRELSPLATLVCNYIKMIPIIYIYTLQVQFPRKTFSRKPNFLGNQMCVRVARQSLANHYGLAYQAIARKKNSVSEGLTGNLSVQVFSQVLFDPKVQRNCLTAPEGLRQANPLDLRPDYLLREKREKKRERER